MLSLEHVVGHAEKGNRFIGSVVDGESCARISVAWLADGAWIHQIFHVGLQLHTLAIEAIFESALQVYGEKFAALKGDHALYVGVSEEGDEEWTGIESDLGHGRAEDVFILVQRRPVDELQIGPGGIGDGTFGKIANPGPIVV